MMDPEGQLAGEQGPPGAQGSTSAVSPAAVRVQLSKPVSETCPRSLSVSSLHTAHLNGTAQQGKAAMQALPGSAAFNHELL